MKNGYLKYSLLLAFAATAAWAEQPLTVDFTQCTEFAGVGPVSFASASALVPAQFTALSTGAGTGGIVVRAGSCTGVSVNGGPAVPTVFSQVGVEIVPPDHTGDINNYLLFSSNRATSRLSRDMLTGLLMYSEKPASMTLSRSPIIALAVSAITGRLA